METKIVIITSHFLRSFVEESFAALGTDCAIEIAEYGSFSELAAIYRQYESKADAFMISGATALSVIEHAIGPLQKPIVSFHADLVSFYHALVTLFVERRDLDPSRTVFDFLLPIDSDATVTHLIRDLRLPELLSEIAHWVDTSVIDSTSDTEREMAEKCIRLRNENKIDMVLCLYSSIVPVLEEHHVPYYFVYPVREQLEKQVEDLLSRVELQKMRENLPAVIAVAQASGGSRKANAGKRFRQAVERVLRELLMEPIMQEDNGHYYIFTSYRVLSMITRELKLCPFSAILLSDDKLRAAVGYGIGTSIQSAKEYADSALKESLFSGGSYVMDEHRSLLGPLNSDRCLEVYRNVSDRTLALSEKCRLSTLTIQKLLSIVKMTGSSRITTAELAEHMGVTVRNANRILLSLEQGGAAKVVYTHSSNSKGRPVKVYELAL